MSKNLDRKGKILKIRSSILEKWLSSFSACCLYVKIGIGYLEPLLMLGGHEGPPVNSRVGRVEMEHPQLKLGSQLRRDPGPMNKMNSNQGRLQHQLQASMCMCTYG